MTAALIEPVAAGFDWHPTYYTAPLAEDFPSDADRLLRAVDLYWRSDELAEGERFQLDDWQRWLLRHLLERYPDDWPDVRLRGRLRYRQAVVSCGRQNGKSIMAALLGFYGLTLHEPGPLVIGLASSREQAGIVYERVRYVIEQSPVLLQRYKPTGTRGIRHRGGTGSYTVKPAKGAALQGLPISLCLFDELHISPPAMWSAVVNGQRTRRDGLLLGFTTAGDDDSELLRTLYEQGHAAIAAGAAGDPGRFGFFCWEAPEGWSLDNPADVAAANPSVACGRVDVATVQSDGRLLPEPDRQRYIGNRWIRSVNSWLPLADWQAGAGHRIDGHPAETCFGFHRTPSWAHASVVAAVKAPDGTVTCELVASLVRPGVDQLEQLAVQLHELCGGGRFTMDRAMLGNLATRLDERGLAVTSLGHEQAAAAAMTTYGLVADHRLLHPDDELLRWQVPRARARNTGDGFRVSQLDSPSDVDAVIALSYAAHLAESEEPRGGQLF